MNTELASKPATVAGKKDVLVKDINTVIGDSDVLLRGIAGAAADSYTATRATVEGKIGEAKSRLDETRNRIAASAQGIADNGYAYVRDNPWKVAGATAALGLAIGYLFRRR